MTTSKATTLQRRAHPIIKGVTWKPLEYLLAVAMGEVRPDTFREAVQQISRAGTPILGYILNKVKTRRFGYYSRYKYYHYYPSREDSGPSGPGRAPVRKPME